MIVIGIIYYYYNLFGNPLNPVLPLTKMSLEVRIFFIFMIFVVTYPIGLLFAWISWSLLGWMEKHFETFHFKNRKFNFLTKGSKNYFCFDILVEEYELDKTNFYSTCRIYEAYLQISDRKLYHSLDDAAGISNLIRHLTLCTLILSFYFIKIKLLLVILTLFISFFLIVINSAVCFHYSLAILMFGLNEKMKKNESKRAI